MNANIYSDTTTRKYPEYNGFTMCSYLQEMIPMMLEDLKGSRDEEWDKELDRMIFLWREMEEETCTRKNPYEKEFEEAEKMFYAVRGPMELKGETVLEKIQYAKAHIAESPTILDSEEYQDVVVKYLDEEQNLRDYRSRCKDEAIDLLKKHFFSLWK